MLCPEDVSHKWKVFLDISISFPYLYDFLFLLFWCNQYIFFYCSRRIRNTVRFYFLLPCPCISVSCFLVTLTSWWGSPLWRQSSPKQPASAVVPAPEWLWQRSICDWAGLLSRRLPLNTHITVPPYPVRALCFSFFLPVYPTMRENLTFFSVIKTSWGRRQASWWDFFFFNFGIMTAGRAAWCERLLSHKCPWGRWATLCEMTQELKLMVETVGGFFPV